MVREFLKAGLVDRLQVAIVPILLGRGIRLWDDLRGFEDGYRVTAEVAASGITHLTFSAESKFLARDEQLHQFLVDRSIQLAGPLPGVNSEAGNDKWRASAGVA